MKEFGIVDVLLMKIEEDQKNCFIVFYLLNYFRYMICSRELDVDDYVDLQVGRKIDSNFQVYSILLGIVEYLKISYCFLEFKIR